MVIWTRSEFNSPKIYMLAQSPVKLTSRGGGKIQIGSHLKANLFYTSFLKKAFCSKLELYLWRDFKNKNTLTKLWYINFYLDIAILVLFFTGSGNGLRFRNAPKATWCPFL